MKLNRTPVAYTNPNGRYKHKNIEINHRNKTGIPGKSHTAPTKLPRRALQPFKLLPLPDVMLGKLGNHK